MAAQIVTQMRCSPNLMVYFDIMGSFPKDEKQKLG